MYLTCIKSQNTVEFFSFKTLARAVNSKSSVGISFTEKVQLNLLQRKAQGALLPKCFSLAATLAFSEGGDTVSGRWEIGGKKMWEVGDWGSKIVGGGR